LSRFLFCHFLWGSSTGTFEKNPNRLFCFVSLVKEVGGKSKSEERAELSPDVQGELTSDGRAEPASDGNTDGGGWSTSRS